MGVPVEKIIDAIKTLENFRFDKEVAELLGIDNKALATYKSRGELPQYYIKKFCKKYNIELSRLNYFIENIDKYNEDQNINYKNTTTQRRESEEMNIHIYEDHIQLQKDKIANLEKENLRLKESLNNKTPESSHWDDLNFHYETEVELHWTSFGVLGRTVWSVSNLKEQSEILGYSESKLKAMWDVGTKYPDMTQHPIDNILHQDSKDELKDVAKTLPTVFNAIKDMIGSHYIPTKLMYKCKDGSYIGAISYNKIDWRTQRVYSKLAFLIEE